MTAEHQILCGNVADPGARGGVLRLRLWDPGGNIRLAIEDITDRMVADLPDRHVDLLELASYVYCADQAVTRGGDGVRAYGANWRRHFRFVVPVREPDLWRSPKVLDSLRETLGFLSDDEYDFAFERLDDPPPVSRYLSFSPNGTTAFSPKEVLLFSGGLDSLAGAVRDAITDGAPVALVSHRSTGKMYGPQKELVDDLRKQASAKILHVPVWVHKTTLAGNETTQRARSFLFGTLGAVVAQIVGLSRVRFYENGITSFNLPISEQVVGARATRTTHPLVLEGMARFLSALFESDFAFENPFLWKTKTEVVSDITGAGCGHLIRHTLSCAHVWNRTRYTTHCGKCSQCIQRRFATLAARCDPDDDPAVMYGLDLLTGVRETTEDRTMLESYVRFARELEAMSDDAFMARFSTHVARAARGLPRMARDEFAANALALHRRHASEVQKVVTHGIEEHAAALAARELPASCLLVIAVAGTKADTLDEHSAADRLRKEIFSACEELVQKKGTVAGMEENKINDFLCSLLRMRLDHLECSVRDQSREGVSAGPKMAGSGKGGVGELDILIEWGGKRQTILEAFILDPRTGRNVITKHLDKLASYDGLGLPELYVVAYCRKKKFAAAWSAYQAHVKGLVYGGFDEKTASRDASAELSGKTEIRVLREDMVRSGGIIALNHLFLNLYTGKPPSARRKSPGPGSGRRSTRPSPPRSDQK